MTYKGYESVVEFDDEAGVFTGESDQHTRRDYVLRGPASPI
jgi:predicted HicB family RNase H-like nuclease